MPSEKVKEMQSILIDIEMPQKLTNLRSVLTLLAMAKLTNDKNWKQTSEDYSRIHDLIAFINEHYPGIFQKRVNCTVQRCGNN